MALGFDAQMRLGLLEGDLQLSARDEPSQHPLAEAVMRAAMARGLAVPSVEGFDAPIGQN